MGRTIIHVDMDAFYAAVEVRDNPELAGKPLIIGALPHERGVVSTCSYEARKYGVRSAMSIKEAYRLCPDGIYMHPNGRKYKKVSDEIHEVWSTYTDLIEYISLDEGFLDVTGSAQSFGGARNIAVSIKSRTKAEVDLTCSVGIGYSKTSAKIASEEKKPDGLFEIPDAAFFRNLIIDRDVRVIYGIGAKTAEKLQNAGIFKVRDILNNPQTVKSLLGSHGDQIVEMADGIDNREVIPHSEVKSIGREHTFQQDISDSRKLRDALLVIAKELSLKMRMSGLYCRTVTLKVTFKDMKQITRSKSGDALNRASDIFSIALSLLDAVEKRPIRLIGISLSNFTESNFRQLSFDDLGSTRAEKQREDLDTALLKLQKKYGAGIIKTAGELEAEMNFNPETD